MTVFVLEYSHRHGLDLSAYDSQEKAEAAIGEIMTEWMSELTGRDGGEEAAKEIKALLEKKEFLKATTIWMDNVDESFEIHSLEVQ